MSLVNITLTLYIHTQPYELLNLADALEKKQFSDRECIIKQARAHHTARTLTLTLTHRGTGPLHSTSWRVGQLGSSRKTPYVIQYIYIRLSKTVLVKQWNLSYLDTNGAEESVLFSEVSSFQKLKYMQL